MKIVLVLLIKISKSTYEWTTRPPLLSNGMKIVFVLLITISRSIYECTTRHPLFFNGMKLSFGIIDNNFDLTHKSKMGV